MEFIVKNNNKVNFSKLKPIQFDNLFTYLEKLSLESKKKFGPHSFDIQSIVEFYKKPENTGIIGVDVETNQIISYAIIKKGFVFVDSIRYESYGLPLNSMTDCTYAPSVADEWQSLGVGNAMFKFILAQIQNSNYKRIILWGGVQMTNKKAINYYQQNGFIIHGQFNNSIENLDMLLHLN